MIWDSLSRGIAFSFFFFKIIIKRSGRACEFFSFERVPEDCSFFWFAVFENLKYDVDNLMNSII